MTNKATLALPLLLALSSCGGATTGSSSTGGSGGSSGSGGSAGTGGSGTAGTSSAVTCGTRTCADGEVCCNPSCGICVKPNGGCPEIACVDPTPVTPADCNMVGPAPDLLACAQQMGQPADPDVFRPIDLTLHGTVTSVVDGALAAGCMENVFHLRAYGFPMLAMRAKSLTVFDGTSSWDVEYLVGEADSPDLQGAVVDVGYHFSAAAFGPTHRQLSVVSTGPAVYVASGGEVADLVGLPVKLSRGAVACTAQEMCGNWNGYDLIFNAGTTSAVVEYGKSAQVGDYLVVHGGYREQTSPQSVCSDWSVADLQVGIVRAK